AIIRGRPADFERVMADGTRNVVTAAQEAGVRRFVLASALGLGERTKDAVPYFAAKWEMERAVRDSRLEHVIYRPSFVFGRDGGVLPTFVRLARFAPVTPIIGPGTQRLQPIWVEDLAEYYALAVTEQAAANRTFERGGPDAVSWNELWERLKRVLGVPRPSGLVRVRACGLCHSDLHVVETKGWGMRFPILLGHEGAGVVEEVGSEVTSVASGDRVVVAWRAPCGDCPQCRRGDPRRCSSQLRAK